MLGSKLHTNQISFHSQALDIDAPVSVYCIKNAQISPAYEADKNTLFKNRFS